MIVRKDAGLIVPILVAEKKECDMRDLPEATWREKIRQTLQCNPKQFEHAGRGMWNLKRSAA